MIELRVLFYRHSGSQEACIVYEHVYPAEPLDRRAHKPLDVRAPRYVGRDRENLDTRAFSFFGDGVQGMCAAGGYDEVDAFLSKGEREGSTEPPASAGDYDDFSF